MYIYRGIQQLKGIQKQNKAVFLSNFGSINTNTNFKAKIILISQKYLF